MLYRSPTITQYELEQVKFDTKALLKAIHREIFPHIDATIQIGYARRKELASIQNISDKVWRIHLNSVLNSHETPEQIIRHILIHELIHIEIRPRILTPEEWLNSPYKGKRSKRALEKSLTREASHPPEFAERERSLSQDGPLTSEWLFTQFGLWIRHDPELDGIILKPRIYKELARLQRTSQSRATAGSAIVLNPTS